MALASIMQLLGQTEPAGILAVTAVDDITKRVHTFLRIVIDPYSAPGLTINERDLFTAAQILDCFCAFACRDAVGDPAAIAAAIETEHQSRFCGGSSVHERVDTKRTMRSHKTCVTALQKVKAWPPHQRTVGENPELFAGLIGMDIHRGGQGPR